MSDSGLGLGCDFSLLTSHAGIFLFPLDTRIFSRDFIIFLFLRSSRSLSKLYVSYSCLCSVVTVYPLCLYVNPPEGVQPKMSPMISFSGMYQKSFIYLCNRTNSQ